MRKIVVAVGAIAAAFAIGVPTATAQTPAPTMCNGTLSGVIEGDVRVPRLASCELRQAYVSGNVTTAINALSLKLDRTIVVGNVECGFCREFEVGRSAVGGSMLVRESTEGARLCGSLFARGGLAIGVGTALDVGNSATGCSGNVFGETLTVRLTLSPATLEGNVIGGDLQVNENREGVTLNRNFVAGALACAENDPAPTGSENFARAKEGQCADF
jgi:hypothetical protein